MQYVQNYQGLNKWAYLHSVTGHEGSGSLVETLDRDLPEILTKLLATNDELVVFLMSDHGMRYGEWSKFMDGSQEHKLPAMFMIASTSLLRDIDSSLDILAHNSKRLVSKLDLHRTLRHLAHIPYYRGYTRISEAYRSWATATEAAVSLLMEKVPNTRRCEDVLIPSFFCSCTKFHNIEQSAYSRSSSDRDGATSHFVTYLAKEVLSLINEETRTSWQSQGNQICAKLTLGSIEKAQYQVVSNYLHVYRLEMTVQQSPTALFEVMVSVLTQQKRPKAREPPEFDAEYKRHLLYSKGRKLFKVLQVKRNDSYEGLCEELSRLKGVPAPLCVCHHTDIIRYNEPKLLNGLLEHKQ